MLVVKAESKKWLEKFNKLFSQMYGSGLKIGDLVEDGAVIWGSSVGYYLLSEAFDDFNRDVAHEKVIWLQEVE